MAREKRIGGPWDRGIVKASRDVALAPDTFPPLRLQDVISVEGNYNCSDFYLDVQYETPEEPPRTPPPAGWADVWLSLWAVNGTDETLLVRKRVADHEGILLPQRGSGPRKVKSVLLSVRGRPCDHFIVRAQVPPLPQGYTEYARANVRLEGWGEDSTAPNDLQGRTTTEPYAPRANQLFFTGAINAGVNIILRRTGLTPWPDDDRRILISHISISVERPAAPPPAVFPFVDIQSSIAPISLWGTFINPNVPPYPFDPVYHLRGERSANILAVLTNPEVGATYWLNAIGYLE